MAVEFFRDRPDSGYVKFVAHGPANPRHAFPDERPSASIDMNLGWVEYGHDTGSNTDNIAHNAWAKPGDQLQLFEEHPSEITGAFADYRVRAYTPTLLGMAINEATKVGTGLTYSHDLSRHSAKLAKMGMELGVVSPNIDNYKANQTNDIGEYSLDQYTYYESIKNSRDFRDVATPEEVQAGRKTIRNIVRNKRLRNHMGPQFENTNPEGWYQPKLGE